MFKTIKENINFTVVLIIAILLMLIYVSTASSNVPVMDYWRYIDALVDKMYTQGLSFMDLYSNNGIHHTPVQLFLFACNVKFLNLNTQAGIYLGVFGLALLCCLVYGEYKKLINKGRKTTWGMLSILAIMLVIYNLNQYEILTLQFAFMYSIRACVYFISFILTNRFLLDFQHKKDSVFALAALYAVVICFFSGGYFVAYAVSISLVIIWNYIRNAEKRQSFPYYVVLGVGMLMGTLLYMHGMDMAGTGATTVNVSAGVQFIKGVLLMLGTSLVGTTVSLKAIYLTGILQCVFHVITIFLYIKKGIYKRTYLPALLYLYTLFIMVIVWVSRAGTYDINYLTSSRYTCETGWLLIADIFIVGVVLSNVAMKKKVKKITKCVSLVIIAVIVINVTVSDVKEIKIAPYRKIYANELIQKMYIINELADEDLIQFQSPSVDYVRTGVDIMKKYHLGVFKYEGDITSKDKEE